MSNSNPSFVFFGTPDVSSATLEILKSHGYIPTLIVTAPDRPVGRHFVMTPSPTKVWAVENNVPFMQPEKITGEILETLKKENSDLFIVVAYGKILPQVLIDIPKLGTLNIHYSLLPRWRGASPVEAAILAGDLETGVSIQKMVFKLDAGPVLAEERLVINPDDTTPSLRGKLIKVGAGLLVKILSEQSASAMRFDGTTQDESLMTHCGKTKKEDGLIDPDHDDPETLYRKYRAYQPWPGLHFFQSVPPRPTGTPPYQGETTPLPKRIKVTKARYEHGKFIIERVVREGEKEMSWN